MAELALFSPRAALVRRSHGCAVMRTLVHQLRRDDLTIEAEPALSNRLALLATISRATRAEPEVVLLRELDRDVDAPVQALELVARFRDGESVVYAYVPLSFGPVQEPSHEERP
jgi:hypothetical protein